MLIHPLVDGIERATLGGEKEVGARVVGELEVELVAGKTSPAEFHCCGAILSLGPRLFDILLLVDFGHHVVAQPSVHYEVAAGLLLEQANDRVRVGHARRVAKTNAGPLVPGLRLYDKLNRVTLFEILPLCIIGTVAQFERKWPDVERRVNGRLQVGADVWRRRRPEATVRRVRPAADAPLGLVGVGAGADQSGWRVGGRRLDADGRRGLRREAVKLWLRARHRFWGRCRWWRAGAGAACGWRRSGSRRGRRGGGAGCGGPFRGGGGGGGLSGGGGGAWRGCGGSGGGAGTGGGGGAGAGTGTGTGGGAAGGGRRPGSLRRSGRGGGGGGGEGRLDRLGVRAGRRARLARRRREVQLGPAAGSRPGRVGWLAGADAHPAVRYVGVVLVRDNGPGLEVDRATVDREHQVGTGPVVGERHVLVVVGVALASEPERGDPVQQVCRNIGDTLVFVADGLAEVGQVGVHHDVAVVLDPGEDAVAVGHVGVVGEYDAGPPVRVAGGDDELDGVVGLLVAPDDLVGAVGRLAVLGELPDVLAQVGGGERAGEAAGEQQQDELDWGGHGATWK